MRMYLSSYDLGSASENITGLMAGRTRAAIVVNALDHREAARAQWLESQSRKLAALGLQVRELDLRDYFGHPQRLRDALAHIDLLWVNGGNAFILRRAMRQSGCDLLLSELLGRDQIVYAGFSAAAVIASTTLGALTGASDPVEVPAGYAPEVVWEGLGLLPFAVVVHVDSDHPESTAMDAEIRYYQERAMAYRTLQDGQALVLRDGRVEVVGIPT
ncbi:Type 1 glutamine amidotransferase-like domain-containing protein [Herbaspirillum sp. NPDC087042]|uniref:Type 1 glutamine amidotransferase-like domain-containing protein n=1 Tax=Herbaspirillum sp. NPDC087042 TaxID=3364004 RepID=UPI00381F073D